MASGFYEWLGIEPTSSAARVRSAYGQALARLSRERRERDAEGQPTSDLDAERRRLDEAWAVLSDPMRRRRYDALRAWSRGAQPTAPADVWAQVGESLVHPAAAVAVRFLRVTSHLAELGELPRAPSGADQDPATLIPHDDDLTTPRLQPGGGRTHHLRLVEGGARAGGRTSDVIVLPTAGLRPTSVDAFEGVAPREVAPRAADGSQGAGSGLSPEDAQQLTEAHGPSGALLRAARERLGLSLRAVSEHTRISEAYLEAVEAEALSALPSETFVRGYVRQVARMLGLDADLVMKGYIQRIRAAR